MRIALMVLVLAAISAGAGAQEASACHPVSPTEQVIVTHTSGKTIRGTVLCLTDSDLLLAAEGRVQQTPLDAIQKVVTRADPVWDGAMKGAAIPLVIWAVWCRECDAGFMLRPTVSYALIGLTFDALQTNRKILYQRDARSASVAWRVRF